LDARPGHGESIRSETELLHQVEVVDEAVVVIAGLVAGVSVEDLPRYPTEDVPDRRFTPVLVDCAFDLI